MSSDLNVDTHGLRAGGQRIAALATASSASNEGAIHALEDFGGDDFGAAFAANYPDTAEVFTNKSDIRDSCGKMGNALTSLAGSYEAADDAAATAVNNAGATATSGTTPNGMQLPPPTASIAAAPAPSPVPAGPAAGDEGASATPESAPPPASAVNHAASEEPPAQSMKDPLSAAPNSAAHVNAPAETPVEDGVLGDEADHTQLQTSLVGDPAQRDALSIDIDDEGQNTEDVDTHASDGPAAPSTQWVRDYGLYGSQDAVASETDGVVGVVGDNSVRPVEDLTSYWRSKVEGMVELNGAGLDSPNRTFEGH